MGVHAGLQQKSNVSNHGATERQPLAALVPRLINCASRRISASSALFDADCALDVPGSDGVVVDEVAVPDVLELSDVLDVVAPPDPDPPDEVCVAGAGVVS